jgi:hypothetical protein
VGQLYYGIREKPGPLMGSRTSLISKYRSLSTAGLRMSFRRDLARAPKPTANKYARGSVVKHGRFQHPTCNTTIRSARCCSGSLSNAAGAGQQAPAADVCRQPRLHDVTRGHMLRTDSALFRRSCHGSDPAPTTHACSIRGARGVGGARGVAGASMPPSTGAGTQ